MAERNSWIRRGLSRAASTARTCRPCVERLEDRLVPAAGGTPNQNYVEQLFLDLTGRPASAQSLASLSGELDRKGPHARMQVVLAVEKSPDYRTAEVEQAYAQILERPAQPGEVGNGVEYLQGVQPVEVNGGRQVLIGTGTIEQLKANLIGSAAFFRKNEGNETRFVRDAYHDALGFVPGPALVRQGRETLAGGTSRFLFGLLLLDGPTAIQKEVQAFFPQYLRRASDPATLNRLIRFGVAHDGSHPHQGIDLVLARLLATDVYFQLAQKNLTGPAAPPASTPTGNIPTATTLDSVSADTANNTLTFRATVSPTTSGGFSTDGGLVDIIDVTRGTTLGTGTLGNGTVSVTVPVGGTSSGDRIQAAYRGSAQFAPSQSAQRLLTEDDDDGVSPDLRDNDGNETAMLT